MNLLQELGYSVPPQTNEELAEMACAFAEQEGYTKAGFEIPMSASFILALNYPETIYDGEQFTFENLDFSLNVLNLTKSFKKISCVRS